MLLYLAVAIWPLIIQRLYAHGRLVIGNRRVEFETHLIIAMTPIFVLLAFRSGKMGNDTATYVRQFGEMIDIPLEYAFATSRMEQGYLVFVKALTFITHNGLVYQVICVTIMMMGMYFFLIEHEKDAFLFLYFYCTLGLFFFMFTGTRQCLAMTICLFSYRFAQRKQYIRFLLCVVLAYYFHKSAVLFVIVPLVMLIKVNLITTIIYIIVPFILGRYLQAIQTWFNDTLDYSYGIESTGSGMIFLMVIIVFTVFSMIQLFNSGYIGKNNTVMSGLGKETQDFTQEVYNLLNINFITLAFWAMRLQTRVAERPSYYFLFFSCLLFAKAFNRITENQNRQLYWFLMIGFTLALYVYRLSTNFASFVPYQFYS
ncbi:MAG: EpsG family protein [Hespellia sp.]|nr:EpsG family protein [Hespellia sp.]